MGLSVGLILGKSGFKVFEGLKVDFAEGNKDGFLEGDLVVV